MPGNYQDVENRLLNSKKNELFLRTEKNSCKLYINNYKLILYDKVRLYVWKRCS